MHKEMTRTEKGDETIANQRILTLDVLRGEFGWPKRSYTIAGRSK
jgi:hypothetical protein